jgi:hypothetical protein
MVKLTPDAEMRKQAIYESMSPRLQRQVQRKGYAEWNPFEKPKDPIDIRRDKSRRTTQALVREFLQSRTGESYSNTYAQGVLEIALGIVNEDEKYQAMYEFSCWYRELLQREAID